MTKSKKTPAQKVSQLVSLIDNMRNCEYTAKQLKTIKNQINRLEKELNLPTKTTVGNLCKVLGWKENTEYQIGEKRYKIVNNVLYCYEPMLGIWQRNQGQLSKLQQFQEAQEIHDTYYLQNEELNQYGYLSVVNFQTAKEYILFDENKQICGIKNIFNKSECNYLQNKYKVAKICDMIPVEK
jgi:hypothetical protein